MAPILIGGDLDSGQQFAGWLRGWGLNSSRLAPETHPAAVPADQASAVIYACGPAAPPLPNDPGPTVGAAPLVLVGPAGAPALASRAWTSLSDPGPGGRRLAAALRPCLDADAVAATAPPGFRDFLNHELRTPLTAAGTALQTLALQLERSGGPSLALVDLALRNLRRLEETVDWTCDYVADTAPAEPGGDEEAPRLTELLQDLDELEAPLPLSWATGPGAWDLPVRIDRARWRRLLRQLLRAVAYQTPGQAVRLELSTLDEEPEGPALLLVFQLASGEQDVPVQRTGAQNEAEQLRRLLAFTVNPDLSRRLGLRCDVVRLPEQLRLRVLLPLTVAELPQPV